MSPNNAVTRVSLGEVNAKEWLSGSSLNCNVVFVAAPTAVPTTVPTTASTAVSATGPTVAHTAVCNAAPTTISVYMYCCPYCHSWDRLTTG